jgi:hypothetical protein
MQARPMHTSCTRTRTRPGRAGIARQAPPSYNPRSCAASTRCRSSESLRSPPGADLTSEVLYQLSYAAAVGGVTSLRAANRPSTAARWLRRVAGDPRVCGLPIGRPMDCLTFRGAGTPVDAIGERRQSLLRTRQKLARNSARIAHELPSYEPKCRAREAMSLEMRTICRVV